MIKPLRQFANSLPNKNLKAVIWKSLNGHRYYKVIDDDGHQVYNLRGSTYAQLGERGYMLNASTIDVHRLKTDSANYDAKQLEKANKPPRKKRVTKGPF